MVSLPCRPLPLNRRSAWRLASLAAAALLSACGGGDPVATPTSVGTTGGTPTVTDAGVISTATVPAVGRGAPATFYVTGTSLENVVPSINGCASVESSISNKSIVVQCTAVTASSTLTLTLTSQGQAIKTVAVPVITISSMALTRLNGVDVSSAPPATLKFGDRVTYLLQGANLDPDKGGTIQLDGCVRQFPETNSADGTTYKIHCDIADTAPTLTFLDAQGYPITNGQVSPTVSTTKPVVTFTYMNEANSSDTFNVDVELQNDVAPRAAYNFLFYALPPVSINNSVAPSGTAFYASTVFHESSSSSADGTFLAAGIYKTSTTNSANGLALQTGTKGPLIGLELKSGTTGSALSNTRGFVAGVPPQNLDFTSRPLYLINLGDNSALFDDQLAVFGVVNNATQLTNLETKVQQPGTQSITGDDGVVLGTVPSTRYKVSAVSVSR